MKTLIKCAIIIPITLASFNGFSQTNTTLSGQIDFLLRKNNQTNMLNGNILVIKKHKVLIERSFGFADPQQKIRLDKEFKFLIGSIYKEFPAVAIMQLYEKGLINVEDNVGKYIPELPIWSKVISIKNLLQYSSGLPDFQSKKYTAEKVITTNDMYNDLSNIKDLVFKPGIGYLYTNYSPLLLMRIVEKVSGQTFNDYAKTFLFNSDHINIKKQYPYHDNDKLAISYNSNFEADPFKLEIPFLFVSNAYGLYDWFERIDGNTLISERSKIFLGKTANVFIDKSMQSSLGKLNISTKPITNEIKVVEHTHDGSFGNFKCIARSFTQEDLIIIILTNQNITDLYKISDEIYQMVKQD